MAEQNENFAPRQEPHIQDDNVYPPKDTHEELKSQAEEEAKIAFEIDGKVRKVLETHLENPYNKFCVDCHHNESTHVAAHFGIFLCSECANEHLKSLGMEHSYIKEIFADHWDQFQLKMLDSTYGGGNHTWFE